jgi:hypothetical protein
METVEQGIEVNLRGEDYFLVNNVDKEDIESWHKEKSPIFDAIAVLATFADLQNEEPRGYYYSPRNYGVPEPWDPLQPKLSEMDPMDRLMRAMSESDEWEVTINLPRTGEDFIRPVNYDCDYVFRADFATFRPEHSETADNPCLSNPNSRVPIPLLQITRYRRTFDDHKGYQNDYDRSYSFQLQSPDAEWLDKDVSSALKEAIKHYGDADAKELYTNFRGCGRKAFYTLQEIREEKDVHNAVLALVADHPDYWKQPLEIFKK